MAADQGLGVGIAWSRLLLGLSKSLEQIVDDPAFVLIHGLAPRVVPCA